MRSKPTPPASIDQLPLILDWLAQPQEEDSLADLHPLREHAASLARISLPSLHRLKILELMQQRVELVENRLIPLLLDAKLPLPSQLASMAQGLIELRSEIGETWLKIGQEASAEELGRVHRSTARICVHGLGNLQKQLLATLLVAIPVPLRLWRNIQMLYDTAYESVDPTATLPVDMTQAEICFKSMLALAASQPEGLAPREIAFLNTYVASHASAIRLSPQPPDSEDDWFWIEANLDQPPVALARREPGDGRCLYFRCGELADLTGEHLRQLAEGTPPATLGLPIQAAGADYRNALERARQCWSAPRRRSFNRREKNLQVEVCTHLSTLWNALGGSGSDAPQSAACELTTSDWTVLNEGPAGYAMAHVSGQVSGLVPGCAVGLRTGEDTAWQICLVRWARSEGSNHVELGLEILAPSALPVRLQPANQREPGPPVPALLLPALPSLNRGEAILSARGDYNARPFTLLLEADGKVQIVECMPRRSLVETSSIEVFEFVREARAV